MRNKEQVMAILDTIANELLKLRRLTETEVTTFTEATIPPKLVRFAQNMVITGSAVARMKKLVDTE